MGGAVLGKTLYGGAVLGPLQEPLLWTDTHDWKHHLHYSVGGQ